jgi:hypothetical protein
MNSLPLDTWIRLIDWMAIGLVIYFGYSYFHSHLGKTETSAEAEAAAAYKPPVAAIIGIVLVLALTLWQVTQPSSRLGMGLQPELHKADNMAVNLGIRLFAWILTGILVAVLMYGRGDRGAGRNPKTKSLGLTLAVINILIWAAITTWYFMYVHGQ